MTEPIYALDEGNAKPIARACKMGMFTAIYAEVPKQNPDQCQLTRFFRYNIFYM